MNTLIVYASKHGTTEEIAKLIGNKITGDVDYLNLKIKKDINLHNYDCIIIGTAVYAGMPMKEANNFINNNLELLKERTLALFTSGMCEGEEALQIIKNIYPEDLIKHAKISRCLGGGFKFSKMNFFEKQIVKMVTKKKENINYKDDILNIDLDEINNFVRFLNE